MFAGKYNNGKVIIIMQVHEVNYTVLTKKSLRHKKNFKLSKSGQILRVDKTGFSRPGHIYTMFKV